MNLVEVNSRGSGEFVGEVTHVPLSIVQGIIVSRGTVQLIVLEGIAVGPRVASCLHGVYCTETPTQWALCSIPT